MPGEYLVPVYEPNHTYDCVVYDAPNNGTMKCGQTTERQITTTSTTGLVNTKDDESRNGKKTRECTEVCSKRQNRCVIVTGVISVLFCLVLTVINVFILLSFKNHQDTKHSMVTDLKGFNTTDNWEWGPWSSCKARCGYGMKSRERYCGNRRCDNGFVDKDICYVGKCDEDSSPVGFSAAIKFKLEDVKRDTIIVYQNVNYNHGGGYSNRTGIFTCPQTGTYLFVMFVQGEKKTGSAHQTSLAFMVDNQSKRSLVSEPAVAGQDETGGNAIVIHMSKGQKAWVETYYEDGQILYPGRTTFTGVLLR